jgi:hypothetical protein
MINSISVQFHLRDTSNELHRYFSLHSALPPSLPQLNLDFSMPNMFQQIPSYTSVTPSKNMSWTQEQLKIYQEESAPGHPRNSQPMATASPSSSRRGSYETQAIRHAIAPSSPGNKWPATNGKCLILTGGSPDHNEESFEYDYSSDSDSSEDSFNYDDFDDDSYSFASYNKHAAASQAAAYQHLNLERELLHLELSKTKVPELAGSQYGSKYQAQKSKYSVPSKCEEVPEPQQTRERATPVTNKEVRMKGKGNYSARHTTTDDRGYFGRRC